MAVHITPTLSSNLSLLSDADLTRAVSRAYREAARSYRDLRSNTDPILGRMLAVDADMAESWWADLVAEQECRIGAALQPWYRITPVEDRSSDVYTVADEPEAPLTSPWVNRAITSDMAAMPRGAVRAGVSR